MAQLIVRNIEDEVKELLAERARRNGHSMEQEVRTILRNAVDVELRPANDTGLGTQLVACFEGAGLDEPLPEFKGQAPRPAAFD